MNRIEALVLDVDGVITDNRLYITPSGEQAKSISFRDLDAIGRARAAGLKIALATGESGPAVDGLAARIGCDAVVSGAKDKRAALLELSDALGVSTRKMCFVGDAERDALAFGMVGLSLSPRDAAPPAKARASRVLASAGGSGAVAEAVDLCVALNREALAAPARGAALARALEASIEAHLRLRNEGLTILNEISGVLIEALRSGRKVLICGNGGSAADAQHVAAELVGRFFLERDALPALALTTDTSILTAVGNDWEYADVFARQVKAHGRPGDVLIGISTSGNSENVLRALRAAAALDMVTIGFTGQNGDALAKACQHCFLAPTSSTPRIQELHILAFHGICEVVEAALADHSGVHRLPSEPPPGRQLLAG